MTEYPREICDRECHFLLLGVCSTRRRGLRSTAHWRRCLTVLLLHPLTVIVRLHLQLLWCLCWLSTRRRGGGGSSGGGGGRRSTGHRSGGATGGRGTGRRRRLVVPRWRRRRGSIHHWHAIPLLRGRRRSSWRHGRPGSRRRSGWHWGTVR